MKPFAPFRPILLAAAAALSCGAASAQGAGSLDQKFWLQLGVFHPSIDSEVRVDRSNNALSGSDIDMERDLGLSSRKSAPSLLLGARINDRWRAEFEYFSLKRHATQPVLGSSIVVDDTVFPVNAVLSSRFDSQVYRASVGYSFYKTPQAEAGAVLGLHVTQFKLDFEGEASVGEAPVAVSSERRDKTVPLPTIGFYGTYAFSQNWLGSARIDAFSIKARGTKGSLVNMQANVLYRFTPNLALGGGYRFNEYRVRSDRESFNGKVNYKFHGPQLFVEAGF
jgi:hypothetical protein